MLSLLSLNPELSSVLIGWKSACANPLDVYRVDICCFGIRRSLVLLVSKKNHIDATSVMAMAHSVIVQLLQSDLFLLC